jgi:hypothetical protein
MCEYRAVKLPQSAGAFFQIGPHRRLQNVFRVCPQQQRFSIDSQRNIVENTDAAQK